jgi:hypothetical protein
MSFFPVRSEESAIYTRSRNLTIQIYVGTPDVDLGTSDVWRKHYSSKTKVRAQQRPTLGLPTCARAKNLAPGPLMHARTADASAQPMQAQNRLAWSRDSRWVRAHRPQRRDSRLTSGLPTPTNPKTILRAREVLECLYFDLVFILEHSIFLRPTKFYIPLYSTAYLTPKAKELTLKLRFEFDAFFNSKNWGIPFHLRSTLQIFHGTNYCNISY